MSSNPSVYYISIAGASGSAPNDGFVDPKKAEQYLANPIGADGINEASLDNFSGFTFANAQAKRRANIRYNEMVAQMGFVGNMYICNVTATGASANTAASTLGFTVYVEHGDGSLNTWDELNPGALLTDPATVLARTISRALVENVVVQADILDPTPRVTEGTYGAVVSVPRYGVRYQSLAVGPVYADLSTANAAITVTPVFQPTE
jgi:hypothetical protein